LYSLYLGCITALTVDLRDIELVPGQTIDSKLQSISMKIEAKGIEKYTFSGKDLGVVRAWLILIR
jgi:hypothetical protein